MSDPGSTEAEVINLSDDYIQNLQPEHQRYDITLSSDFVISVLPNGIKTWAFIYDFQGRHRRKTLGVFPDMSFADAREALGKARQVMVRMDEPTVPPDEMGRQPAVLGGGKYIPKEEPVGSNKVLWFIVLSIIAAAAAAGGWYYLQNKSAKPADTIKKPEVDTSRPFAVEPARRSNSTSPFPEVDEPQETQPEKPDTTTDDQQPPANSGDDSQSTSNPATTESINASAGGNSNTDITSGGDQARSSTTASDTANQDSQPAVEQSPPVIRTSVPAPTTVTNNSSGNASGATSLGGSVPRSRLTSAVRNLEPVDILGPDITYKNSGFTRVFYFTELREFSDGHIIHRWEHNGVVTDEVKLRVQNSWRWRTYSNKDITPGLTGNWKVSVIDSAGREIDAETFTYGYE